MSNDYTLPPVPEWAYEEVRDNQVKAYGQACAEAARAPLAEENARLLVRVAELEVDLRISRDASKCLEADRDRLRAEVEAKAGEVEALRGFAQQVMGEWPEGCLDGFELQDTAEAFGLIRKTRVEGPCGEDCACLAACADWPTDCYHRTALLTGSAPWVNPLAAEVSALRRLLFSVYTAPGMGYTNDGELQDSTVHPSIDFLRMTTEQIQEAIRRREGKGGRLGDLAAEVEKLRASMSISEALDEYEARTKALPCQHEIPERGCSTYNWQMAAIRDLRAIAARPEFPPNGLPSKESGNE